MMSCFKERTKLSNRLKLKTGKITYDDIPFDVNANLIEYVTDLKEDLLQVSYDKPNYVIDVGWTNDFSIDGQFKVSIVKDYEWDAPYKIMKVDTIPDLLKALQKCIDEVEELVARDVNRV